MYFFLQCASAGGIQELFYNVCTIYMTHFHPNTFVIYRIQNQDVMRLRSPVSAGVQEDLPPSPVKICVFHVDYLSTLMK